MTFIPGIDVLVSGVVGENFKAVHDPTSPMVVSLDEPDAYDVPDPPVDVEPEPVDEPAPQPLEIPGGEIVSIE